jgi:hypothetical protein
MALPHCLPKAEHQNLRHEISPTASFEPFGEYAKSALNPQAAKSAHRGRGRPDTPASPSTQCDRKLSPPTVSQKREFPAFGLETFGRFSPKLPFSGDGRPTRNARNPYKMRGFCPQRCLRSVVERLVGWRRSADRTSQAERMSSPLLSFGTLTA